MPKPSPSDKLREDYLDMCTELLKHTQDMRNFAMKPGNAWLARGELSKIVAIVGDLESLLDDIKQADEQAR